ncbi:Chemotaxis protein CheY [Geodia barretti]|uniref:Chemotaxis protein CheY n=1 Tax=Geodia barretti TaxID=519541 RepID=A0AA35T4Q7_GEOBA|nr:Chemotaxis protein CheY [Geodia barretti]
MVVDDHEIMRDGLREVLQRTGDYEVCGQAGDGVSAVNIALELKPDVIIMDVMMPLKNGIDACREITEMLPDTRC